MKYYLLLIIIVVCGLILDKNAMNIIWLFMTAILIYFSSDQKLKKAIVVTIIGVLLTCSIFVVADKKIMDMYWLFLITGIVCEWFDNDEKVNKGVLIFGILLVCVCAMVRTVIS